MRQSHYDRAAAAIQALWRGFWTRKHVFNYAARKAYLRELAAHNERVRCGAGVEGVEVDAVGLRWCPFLARLRLQLEVVRQQQELDRRRHEAQQQEVGGKGARTCGERGLGSSFACPMAAAAEAADGAAACHAQHHGRERA